MNLAHLHLLLNHFPTIGFVVGLTLYMAALASKSMELKRASYVIFFMIAVIAIPAYFTGNAAERVLRESPGVSEVLIGRHEGAALVALIFMEITGFVAWAGLWHFHRVRQLGRWNMTAVLVLAVLTFGLVARAASIGGEIRHPEISAASPAPTEENSGPVGGFGRAAGSYVTANPWVWPAAEALHFVGLCFLFTVVLIVDLRILGIAKRLPFSALYQLLPVGMIGFGVNLVTGMLFFLASPDQYTNNVVFFWKILFVVVGGINILYFMLFDEPWTGGAGDEATVRAKFAAASAIGVWLGVLYFGHMLPFIGNAF